MLSLATLAFITLFSLSVNAQTKANDRTVALEQQVSQMAAMLKTMQAELDRIKSATANIGTNNTDKLQELDQWMASIKHSNHSSYKKQSMVFFRGGYVRLDHGREGDILTDANTNLTGTGGNVGGLGLTTNDLTGNRPNGDNEGWYFGAGVEFNITDDLYGFMDNTNLLGEISFTYKEFDVNNITKAPLATAANDSASGGADKGAILGVVCGDGGLTDGNGGPYGDCAANIAVTQFTLTAAPKIKFMGGSKLRPWIIPAGFEFNVVSPPTDAVTYFAPGVLFGIGADYDLWNNIYVGVDARYHLVADTVDNVDLGGFEAGGYIGFGF